MGEGSDHHVLSTHPSSRECIHVSHPAATSVSAATTQRPNAILLIALADLLTGVLLQMIHSLQSVAGWTFASLQTVVLASVILSVMHRATRVSESVRGGATVRQVGQYSLKQQLAVGGMGEVHLAEHQLLHRPCVVKLIRPCQQLDASVLARFEREVQVTANLTHPNAVQIFDFGRADDGTFYYAMEYLPGLSLEQMVERHHPLAPARVIHVLLQICGALREAHALGPDPSRHQAKQRDHLRARRHARCCEAPGLRDRGSGMRQRHRSKT